MVEITIDLHKIGYFIGRYGITAAKTVGKSALLYNGGTVVGGVLLVVESTRLINYSYNHLSKCAILHKIDVNDPSAVTENVFNCLGYLD